MAIFNRNLAAVSIAAVLATACGGGGGTAEPVPGADEVVSAVESTATDAAAAVQETANDVAGEAVSGWTNLQDNWQDSIGSIKDRWADLTEEELLMVNGDKDQLVALVQQKYGLEREAAENEVEAWASSL